MAVARGGGDGVVKGLRMARASDAKAGAKRFARFCALSDDGSVSNAASLASLAGGHVLTKLLNSFQHRLHSLRAQSATRVEQRLHDALNASSTLTPCSPPPTLLFLFAARQALP